MTIETFGWLGTALFIICYIPQIWHTYKTKSFDGVSLFMWFVQWAAYSSCLVYSLSLKSKPLMFGYSMGWLMTAWYLELYRQYRRK
jgi:uncharacterized protein with PQ loop repeat